MTCTIFRKAGYLLAISALALMLSPPVLAQLPKNDPCQSTALGGRIESPPERRSHNGILEVTLSLHQAFDTAGRKQYCYLDERGHRSPTLRARPGDLLILNFTNELEPPRTIPTAHPEHMAHSDCASAPMTPDTTNLHFHGLSVPPTCHADDSLRTSVTPSARPFVYRFRIPKDQPPGLYWYHPHPHGHSEEQVLGGASGALIVEGIASANPHLSGLPERVLVIRDQQLSSGVTANPNHDPTVPAKDLSVNFVPIPYPEYPIGTIETAPLKRELWRVLNASADTYVDLGVLLNGEWKDGGLAAVHGSWQKLGLIAIDGVPFSGSSAESDISWRTDIPIPPGGRAEFLVQTPSAGAHATLFTAGAEINPPDDEDNPNPALHQPGAVPDRDDFTPPRPLARIVSAADTREAPPLDEPKLATVQSHTAALASVQPIRQRKLYFSEKVLDPKHPETSTVFYLTEEGHVPKAFDPSDLSPNIVVHQGDIEDWTIENRSMESHDFHIHQIHFLVLERNGAPAADQYVADTVDVPYWDGNTSEYPSVKLRMDFRSPEIVGTFPYHCHILQHSDAGMMGLIQVLPRLMKNTRPTKGG